MKIPDFFNPNIYDTWVNRNHIISSVNTWGNKIV